MPPRIRDLTALEDHVVDGEPRQAAAHREPGMTGTDDDDVDGAGQPGASEWTRGHRTSTATLVGFVTMSNTAERFCDCATRAAMSSRDASASISNTTLIPSKPLRTSLSMPRMPCRSMPPSSVALTERNWIERFWATAAMPAVRQEARPTRTYSTGVAPLSSAAKTSG